MRVLLLTVAAGLVVGCSVERVDDGDADGLVRVEKDVTARLDYFEFPASDPDTVDKTREFYAGAFGWTFTDFGPDYSATTTGDVDIGLSGLSGEDSIDRPLPVIRVEDLEVAMTDVEAAGGRVVRPIFAFPGGRRFHAVDPAGNEFAVYVAEEIEADEADE